VKRFKIPDEFNSLKIFQQIFQRSTDQYAKNAADTVAQTYEDRRQYSKAAIAWQAAIAKFGDENHRQQRLDQIVKNWGRFENLQMQPAGKGATIDLRYRNGKQIALEAHAIKIDKLLDDVKAYLKHNWTGRRSMSRRSAIRWSRRTRLNTWATKSPPGHWI
jgi:hypothetical protein